MSALLTVRFPSGATEFRMTDDAPEVGDVLKRDGDCWIVGDVTRADDGSAVVTLSRIEPGESDVDGPREA
jgi:hypothetical protein